MTEDLQNRVARMTLMLRGLRDPVIVSVLPGAPRVADEATQLLTDLLKAVQSARPVEQQISENVQDSWKRYL